VNGCGAAQPFGFTGREHDLDAGLVYARARYLNPGTGRFIAPDRLSMSVGRNGGLVADTGLRQLMQLGGYVSELPEYLYANGIPTLFRDPSGLTVLYAGVGGTVATFGGGVTGGLGMGIGGSPFGVGLLATFGLAFQAGLINISVTADLGIYFKLAHDNICDLEGPFLVEGGDFGAAGISLVWGVDTTALQEALARGTLALPHVSTWPVGIVFSFPLLPKGFVPSSGMTLYGTWSWMLWDVGCEC
jgi:RHS repeat-associated protein